MRIQDYLKEHKLITDGAMGTYYAKLLNNETAVSEYANLTEPEVVIHIHKEYIKAGAELIRTNSFAANQQTLKVNKKEQKAIIQSAYKLAKQAVEESGKEVYIACDIGPIPENGDRAEEEIAAEYKLICDAFLQEKPDIFIFETFSDFFYLKNLIAYIKERAPEVFIITNFTLNKNGYTGKGISAKVLLETIADTEGIDAGGFNCGIGSGHMFHILKKLRFPDGKYIVSAPNAGYPEQFKNRMIFMDNEGYFEGNMQRIVDLGVDIIGGCCGTTPDYIKKIADNIDLKEEERGIRFRFLEDDTKELTYEKNDFYSLFTRNKKVVAVELDPPFDAKDDSIIACAHKLKASGAHIITMADSPMGRSRVDSILMSVKLMRETGISVMPHVCCRDKNMIAMRSGLLGAYINGVRNILVVTGDPIPSEQRQSTTGVFDYNSMQLMNYINEMNREHFLDDPIFFGGALNYGRGPVDKVIERMKKKIQAGAGYFMTQPIFADEDVDRIRYIKSKVNTKILCGIMPLVSYRNANFIKNEITGIHVPDWVVERYHPDMSKEEAERVAALIANEIIEKLSPFADGYYFMLPFNRVSLMDKIVIK
ncbi:bifunctional homocysteine S-methyltransferase/5,10-methylenetetrahydrofolate reductase [Anaerocolumna cellulosilytica]|uniref:Bifunctional homocysteine S-methyltransferase/5,10-methylenetetrahydrofolate reductase n=1 Tax=Anaerocolumna cellulosilytica TaxID=433286 RepID=A0A6S6R0W8_9FIRM|nr:bifunctional homocysteine S-methyltransferase/methylenetetrahydrofolate reductase [Anaerocolumna cellulosilytica]MBB5195995.1 homocysteine S-methyltransferase [Anaerocolumna cellulosilytica]BCJ93707.1 bifunctional homocysteine S-methyltransferase/5,10-methylenetetrahydrofolate reductase [Anaerocolumna cellulosilytica]